MHSEPPIAGLCGACRHARIVANDRGSTFVLCERSRTEPAFPRYPRLPVLACAGFEARTPIRTGLTDPSDPRP